MITTKMHATQKMLRICTLIIIALLVIVIFSIEATKINPKVEIIYTGISDFASTILRDRSPILVRERMVDPIEGTLQLLKYQYATHRVSNFFGTSVRKIESKFSALFFELNEQEQDEASGRSMMLLHPHDSENVSRIEVVMKPDQVLIVPSSWSVFSTSETRWTVIDFYDTRGAIVSLLTRYCNKA